MVSLSVGNEWIAMPDIEKRIVYRNMLCHAIKGFAGLDEVGPTAWMQSMRFVPCGISGVERSPGGLC